MNFTSMTRFAPALATSLALLFGGATSAMADPVAYEIEYAPSADPDEFDASFVHEAANGDEDTYGDQGAWLYRLDGLLTGDLDDDGNLTLEGTLAAGSLTGEADLTVEMTNGVFAIADDGGMTGQIDYAFSDGRNGTFYFDPMPVNAVDDEGVFTLWGQNWLLNDTGDAAYDADTALGIDLRGQPVPEPASIGLGLMGACAALSAARRSREEDEAELA